MYTYKYMPVNLEDSQIPRSPIFQVGLGLEEPNSETVQHAGYLLGSNTYEKEGEDARSGRGKSLRQS